MKLKDCTIGKVVCLLETEMGEHYGKPQVRVRRGDERYNQPDVAYTLVGHIKGFDLNSAGETVVNVLWNDFTRYAVHPSQLLECEE